MLITAARLSSLKAWLISVEVMFLCSFLLVSLQCPASFLLAPFKFILSSFSFLKLPFSFVEVSFKFVFF